MNRSSRDASSSQCGQSNGSCEASSLQAAEKGELAGPVFAGGDVEIQVTMDLYGHLMEGLDDRTADRLDAIAASWSDPGAAQDEDDEVELPPKNP